MPNILVAYVTRLGNIGRMAAAVAEGAGDAPDAGELAGKTLRLRGPAAPTGDVLSLVKQARDAAGSLT